MYYIGIDIGTASTSVVVIDENGEKRFRVLPFGTYTEGTSRPDIAETAGSVAKKLFGGKPFGDDDGFTLGDSADRAATVVLTCHGGIEKDPKAAGRLMDAVRSAGGSVLTCEWRIDVMCVLPGAAASAVYHYVTSGMNSPARKETVLVVDFGDSAFRVSAVMIRPDLGYTVISARECADGCGKLRAIAGQIISQKILETRGISVSTSTKSFCGACAALMKDLNRKKTATVKVRHGSALLSATIKRDEFTGRAVMSYDEQLELTGAVYDEARGARYPPDAVILTGGGMLLSSVVKRISGYLSLSGFMKDVLVPERPDTAEALGAALIAADKRRSRTLDHSYGITITPDPGSISGVLTMLCVGTELPAVSGELAVRGVSAQTVITVFRRKDGGNADISDTRDCTEIRRVSFGIPKDENAWISMVFGADGLITVKVRLSGGGCLTESFRTDYNC